MSAIHKALLMTVAALFLSCSSGGAAHGSLMLLEFDGQGKAALARNTLLTFKFSAPIRTDQNLFERLSIERIPGPDGPGFDQALGDYVVVGEVVSFQPRYPELADRSDSGLHGLSDYAVFCKAGADSLESASGAQLHEAIELDFGTSDNFDDPLPTDPPRIVRLTATDSVTGATTDLSRLSDTPLGLAGLDSATLLAGGRAIDPGAGGGPDYATFWQLDAEVTEPLDPQTVTTKNVELWEIRHDALATADTAPAGQMGDEVSYRVPIGVKVVQRFDPSMVTGVKVLIRVTPLQTLTDDARYRLIFRGNILGIDFRQQFIGVNGLTGADPDAGGLGYVTEFLVYDRPAITTTRLVDFAPLEDGIHPESGATTADPARINYVPYDPPSNPSNVVGVAPIFGDGSDGALAVLSGSVVMIDTGDTPNNQTGNPFDTFDLDPGDTYDNKNWPPAGNRTLDGITPTELQFSSLTVASGGTLRIRGVNPMRIRCQGIVQVSGVIDAGGEDGQDGTSGGSPRQGGVGGPGGFSGGSAAPGLRSCNISTTPCSSFDNYLSACAAAKAAFPFSVKGEGPGRGNQGGEVYQYYYKSAIAAGTDHVSGTGGGGGGHAEQGGTGDDNLNSSGSPGSPGPACDSTYGHQNSSVIGVRGVGGTKYGDRTLGSRFLGGSGGGAGGALHQPTYATASGSGGAGGGGGGWLEIIAKGAILVSGGVIDASGGAGGRGTVVTTYSSYNYQQPTGAGGGGAGGGISLISGDNINLAAGTLDARGGPGGLPANPGVACPACNGGGDGASGYLFLMDPDGFIDGLALPGPGDYDSYGYGILTIRPFQTARFGAITASTELFRVYAADPTYLDFKNSDFAGTVDEGQTLRIYASSARPDAKDPLEPDLSTETALIHVATVYNDAGAVVVDVVPNATELLNPGGVPNRESFLRIHIEFEYEEDVQAATGPYAMLDRVVARIRFNG